MSVVGTTSTGKNMTITGNPFDHAQLIFPGSNSAVRDITNDLTGAVTAQLAAATDTPTTDWGNNAHINRSGSRRGTGNIPVVRNSNADKLLMAIFNAMHPDDETQVAEGYRKFQFTLKVWNSDEPDVTLCECCGLTNMPADNRNNGTANNQQPDTYQFYSTEIHRDLGGDSLLPE